MQCLRIGFLLACVSAVPACVSDRPATGPEPPPTGGSAVAIANFAFMPPALSAPTGTVIIWTNGDDVGHTVSSEDGQAFESGVISRGATFQTTAGVPGTYGYFCRIHPFMKATLTVTP